VVAAAPSGSHRARPPRPPFPGWRPAQCPAARTDKCCSLGVADPQAASLPCGNETPRSCAVPARRRRLRARSPASARVPKPSAARRPTQRTVQALGVKPSGLWPATRKRRPGPARAACAGLSLQCRTGRRAGCASDSTS
jgi:hypothetical protein